MPSADASALVLTAVGYHHQDARRLIAQVQAEYVVRYGTPDESPLDPLMFDPPHGTFLVGYAGGVAVATGAWRACDVEALGSTATAEIKRMYVVPQARGHGHARTVLRELERTALAAGREVLVLETGTAQPEALALYASCGYRPIEPFGHYRDSPLNRSFAKRVGPAVASRPGGSGQAPQAAFQPSTDSAGRDAGPV